MKEENDGFDQLDDKTLHKVCLDHGIPNIPVTKTSRGVLTKKLRSIIRERNAAAMAAEAKESPSTKGEKKSEDDGKAEELKDKTPASASKSRASKSTSVTPLRRSRRLSLRNETAAAAAADEAETIKPKKSSDLQQVADEKPSTSATARRKPGLKSAQIETETKVEIEKVVGRDLSPKQAHVGELKSTTTLKSTSQLDPDASTHARIYDSKNSPFQSGGFRPHFADDFKNDIPYESDFLRELVRRKQQGLQYDQNDRVETPIECVGGGLNSRFNWRWLIVGLICIIIIILLYVLREN